MGVGVVGVNMAPVRQHVDQERTHEVEHVMIRFPLMGVTNAMGIKLKKRIVRLYHVPLVSTRIPI